MASTDVSRREFLHMSGLLGGAAVLAACTPSAPSSGGQPTSAPAAGQPTSAQPAPAEAVTLQHWQSDWGKDWNDPMITLGDSFIKDVAPNVKMEWTFMPQVTEKLLAAVAGGNAPDICTIDEPYGVPKMARAGGLMSLDEYYKRDGVKGEDFIPFTWETVLYEGAPYGIPGGAGTHVNMYNKAIYAEIGLDELPDTPKLEDFLAWNQQVLKRDDSGKIVRVGLTPQTYMYTNGWIGICGAEFYNEDQTKLIVNSDKSVAALETFASLMPKDIPYDDVSNFLAGAPTSGYGTLGSGMEASVNDGFWLFMAMDKYWPDLDYGVCKLPTPNGSKDEWNLYTGWVWDPTIPKGSRHPEEAWAFMKYGYWEHGEMLADTINWTSSIKCFPEFEKRLIKLMGEGNRMEPYLHHFSEAQYAGGIFIPYTPIHQQLVDAIGQAVEAVVRGQQTAKQALDDIVATWQPELDKALSEG